MATEMYGIVEPILRGKMVSPPQEKRYSHQADLPVSMETNIMLYVDILYINGNPFSPHKSKEVAYLSIEKLNWQKLARMPTS
mgnify:CR=1 FL=1